MTERHSIKIQQGLSEWGHTETVSYTFANITHLVVHRIYLLLSYNKQNKYKFKFVTKGIRKSNSLTQVEL